MKKIAQLTLSIMVLAGFSSGAAYGMNNKDSNKPKQLAEKMIREEQCVMCMEDLKDTKNIKMLKDLPCGHVFHRMCLAQNVIGEHADDVLNETKTTKINTKCPLCKANFSPFSLFPQDYVKHHKKQHDILQQKKYEARVQRFENANKEAQIQIVTQNNRYLRELAKLDSSNRPLCLLHDAAVFFTIQSMVFWGDNNGNLLKHRLLMPTGMLFAFFMYLDHKHENQLISTTLNSGQTGPILIENLEKQRRVAWKMFELSFVFSAKIYAKHTSNLK